MIEAHDRRAIEERAEGLPHAGIGQRAAAAVPQHAQDPLGRVVVHERPVFLLQIGPLGQQLLAVGRVVPIDLVTEQLERRRLLVAEQQAHGEEVPAAGLGVARVLSYQVEELLLGARLRTILDAYAPPPLPIHLVRLPAPPSRAAAAFLSFAGEALSRRLRG